MKQIIRTSKAPAPIGPYNQATMVNGWLTMSGQIAIDAKTGELVNDSIEAETHMVMQNIGYVLEAAEMEYSNIMKCSIFIKDMNDFSRINEVYATYFKTDAPARECVEVSRLPKDVRIEISVIAIANA